MGTGAAERVLVVDADAVASAAIAVALRAAGATVEAAQHADAGIRRVPTFAPTTLIVELELPGRDGLAMLRRLRDEYLGAWPRVILIARPEALTRELAGVELDAVALKPIDPARLTALVMEERDGSTAEVDVLRELLRVTVFPGDAEAALTAAARQLARSFRVADAVVAVHGGERMLVGHATTAGDEATAARVLERCGQAATTGALLVTARADDEPHGAYLAAPLESLDGTWFGVVALASRAARRFGPGSTEALRALTARLGGELSWRAVHDRIAADRDRLRERSLVDPMLGVWNRMALDQALPAEVAAAARRAEPLSVAVLDVVGLRNVNEKHGHQLGDAVLRHVASAARQAVRSQDLVCRYAGDAIGLVLPGVSISHAFHVVERLQRDVGESPVLAGEQRLRVEITAGLAEITGEDDTGEAALQRAVAAMTQAKRRGQRLAIADAQTPRDESGGHPGLEVGVTVGGMYQILHEISRGAFGVVYRAEDLGLGRPVALKTLRPDLARDAGLIARFRSEAATLAQLRHQHLVQVHAFGIEGEDVYFVMELVEGEPLEERLTAAQLEGRPLGAGDVIRIVSQIASALDLLHGAGILHRDVKPANILLDRVRDRAVLVDVGIAKRRGSAHDPAGTPGFTAPEAFTGGGEGPATDVYGLAAVTYFMLTLKSPFGEGPPATILRRQTDEPPTPPSLLDGGASSVAVDAVVLEGLDADPARRPQTAGAFAEALRAALDPDEVLDAPQLFELDDEPGNVTVLMWGDQLRPPEIAAPAPRPSLLGLRSVRGPSGATELPLTRGVLFRAAYEVLGATRGARWIREIARTIPTLGGAFEPMASPLAWHTTESFAAMLEAYGAAGEDPHRFARELGRVATAATFETFFGADPTALSPAQVLAAAHRFWRCYHSFGDARVAPVGERSALVEIVGADPLSPLVCDTTAGILEQVVRIAGATSGAVEHVRCRTRGDEVCAFMTRWT